VITLVLTHLDADGVGAMLEHFERTAPGARVALLHGGRREDFDEIVYEPKLFVEDPSLRGPFEQQSYTEALTQAWHGLVAHDPSIDLVYFIEFDHIVLRGDYETALRQVMAHTGADFVGKNCSRRDHTNWPHVLRARNALGSRFAELWGCLGTGMLMTREALEAFAGFDHVPGYLELYVPTVVRHLGFHVDDVDRFSDLYAHVNAPPEKDLAALRAARSEGHFFFHPFKRVEQLGQLT
jgi:hypothetical protein